MRLRTAHARTGLAALATAAALNLAGCADSGPRNTGVYLLLDTSGTYAQELDKAEQIINYTLTQLDALDTFAVARIDTGSFSERDIVAKVTFDDRPLTAAPRSRAGRIPLRCSPASFPRERSPRAKFTRLLWRISQTRHDPDI